MVADLTQAQLVAVTDAPRLQAPPPLAGARACIREHPEVACAMSGANGMISLQGVPAEDQLVLTVEAPGRMPLLLPMMTDRFDHTPPREIVFFTPVSSQDLRGALGNGIELDPTKGQLQVWMATSGGRPALFPGLAGVSLSLARPSGQGPFFTDRRGRPATGARASAGGLGYFANLPPGDHTLRASHPDRQCELGGIGAGPNPWLLWGHLADEVVSGKVSVRVPILAGHVTVSGFWCP